MKIISEAPKSWTYNRLSEFIEELEAGVSVNSSEEVRDPKVRILKTSCVAFGRFDPAEAKPVLPTESDRVRWPSPPA
jgi:type I restriction enzyme S subunit